MNIPSPELRFVENVKGMSEMIIDLIDSVQKQGHPTISPVMVKLGVAFILSKNPIDIIQNFINRSYPHWNEILSRDETFFVKHANSIFGDVPSDSVDAFKELFTLRDDNEEFVVNKDDREAIWEYFDSLIKISIKYIHENRGPKLKEKVGKTVKCYSKHFMDDIDIIKYAPKWKVKLEFPPKEQ